LSEELSLFEDVTPLISLPKKLPDLELDVFFGVDTLFQSKPEVFVFVSVGTLLLNPV
jgi:hypothetical protein